MKTIFRIYDFMSYMMMVGLILLFVQHRTSTFEEDKKPTDLKTKLESMEDNDVITMILSEHLNLAQKIANSNEDLDEGFNELNLTEQINILREILTKLLHQDKEKFIDDIIKMANQENLIDLEVNAQSKINTKKKKAAGKTKNNEYGLVLFVFIIMGLSPLFVYIILKINNKEPVTMN